MAASFANFDVGSRTQARVLGAGPLRRLRHVTLPPSRPGWRSPGCSRSSSPGASTSSPCWSAAGTVKTLPLLLFASLGSPDLTAAAALVAGDRCAAGAAASALTVAAA